MTDTETFKSSHLLPSPEANLRASEIIAKIRHQLEINVQIAEETYPEGPVIDGKRVKGVAHSQDILAQHIRDHLNELEAAIVAPPQKQMNARDVEQRS